LPDSAGPLGKLIYLPDSVKLTGKLQTVREMNILLSVTTVKKKLYTTDRENNFLDGSKPPGYKHQYPIGL
jgi:hypothetical protein